MTTKQMKIAERVSVQLGKLAKLADDHGLLLGNGCEIGSMLGSIADELDEQVDSAKKGWDGL